MSEVGKYDPAYMERNALRYMREYLLNEGDFGSTVSELIAVAARRLHFAGVLADYSEPTVKLTEDEARIENWGEHTSTLSPLGEYLKDKATELYSGKAAFEFNFWPLKTLLDIWPTSWLEQASAQQHVRRELPSPHVVTNFMHLFQLEFPLDESARQYLRDRIRAGSEEAPTTIALPAQLMEVPVQVDYSATEQEDDLSFDDDGFPLSLPEPVAPTPRVQVRPAPFDTPTPDGYEDVEDLEGVWHRRPRWVDPLAGVEDFDFGGLPDEDAGNQDAVEGVEAGDDDGWQI